MRIAAGIFAGIALSLAIGVPTVGAAAKSDPVRLSGRQYIRLSDWARANKFDVRRLDQGRALQLSNRLGKLVFNLDPRRNLRRLEIDGVEVWLSFPLVSRNGATHIAVLDLEQTLKPILWPRTNPPGTKIRTICLDPGHGGKDPGYRINSHEEKKYTLLLAREVRSQLEQKGFDVVTTRDADAFVDLATRTEIARKRKADLFVSLHFNALNGSRNGAQGIETYCVTPAGATSTNARGEGNTRRVPGNCHTDRSMLLAYHVQKSMVRSLSARDRGVRRARWQVLREAQMPAVLIEGGFMSHAVEGQRIFDPAYRRQMARAIVDGILACQRALKG
jgi:N-acetylmuramoyl-L-alanine amidase